MNAIYFEWDLVARGGFCRRGVLSVIRCSPACLYHARGRQNHVQRTAVAISIWAAAE